MAGGDGRPTATRVLQWTAVGLAALLAFAFVATLVLTSTDWGRDRVRRFVVSRLEGMINGEVTIGSVRGNLLTGATIEAFAIRDTAGQPFLAAEQVSARYGILELLSGRIDLRAVRLVRPLIVLDRPPGGEWNYEVIFPRDSAADRRDTPSLDWIVFRDLAIFDGRLVMRTPWRPDTTLSRAAQDSSIREALGGGKRILVVPVANGFQKVVELRNVTARAPLVRIRQPGYDTRLAQIASLRMEALPFRPPAAVVRDMAGTLRFDNDSIWWRDMAVRTPGSQLHGDGRYGFATGDMELAARARPAAFVDFRWLYPRLPADGGGPADFRVEWRGTTQEYTVRNADLRTRGARLRGRFAISFADTFAVHDTDIRFANVNTTLIEQLVPDFRSPRRGTLDGRLTVLGGRNAMQLDGNVAFHDPRTGTSRLAGRGAVGYVDGDVRVRDLRVRVDPLQVALVKALAPAFGETIEPIGGTLVGTLSLSGSTETALQVAGDVEHRDRGGTSRLDGRAEVQLAGTNSFTVDVEARPLALAELGLLAPSAGLRGTASGDIELRGTLGDLRVETELRLADGGFVRAEGRLDLAGRAKRYDLAGTVRDLDLSAALADAPSTSVTGTISARGTGFDLATMNATIAAEFGGSRFRDVAVESGTVRVAIAGGLARVQRLTARARGTRVDATGTFGLAANRTGELRYVAEIDSLGVYDRWIPGTREPGSPRPRGTVHAAGVLSGNIRRFDVRGRLRAKDVVANGNAAEALRAEFAWTNARTSRSSLALAVEGRAVMVRGFAFDTLQARLDYRHPSGRIELAVRQGDDRDYSMRGTFVLGTRRELRLQDLALRMDTTVWRLAHEAVIHSHPAGIEVHDFEVRSNTGGLVYANGMLPTEGNANLVIDIRNLEAGDLTALLQAETSVTGVLTARALIQGSMSDPAFRGAAGLVNATLNGSPIPNVQSTFRYANTTLVAHAETVGRSGFRGLIADAVLPVNLALSGVTGDRLLQRPLRVDVRGDSLPLEMLPAVTDLVQDIGGSAAGALTIRGTYRRPSMTGAVAWVNGTVRVVPTGMVVRDIAARIRLARDTIYVDSLAGQSGGGPVRLAGRVGVDDWRSPTFDLHLVATEARVWNNDRAELEADVGLSLTGPLESAYLAGLVHIREGVAYMPEPTSKRVIAADDPTVFAVMDTATTSDRELFPASSPFLEGMRVDVDVIIDRNTWLRSRDYNIEMFTEEPLRIHREADALALTGVVSTERGEYTFMSKRFQVKRGSATFIGGPELNPAVQATGEYEVALAGRPSFNVRVLIGGTLRQPKLTLESDAQPPIPQSDLLSYLAFGQSTSSLLQLEGSGLTGATTTGNLVGVGAALAMKRMAAVALGVMADEVEGEATRGLGADVFNITPADIPDPGAANVINFFEGTRVEAGKYLSPYFFVALQAQRYPGVRAQYRTPRGWRYEASLEPRYMLGAPTLRIQQVRPVTAFGAFIIREWRF